MDLQAAPALAVSLVHILQLALYLIVRAACLLWNLGERHKYVRVGRQDHGS